MVIDKISNYKLYAHLHDRIGKAFDYINHHDLDQMELGKHPIDHDDVFALIQEYETKDQADCKLEGHFKYIDLQYMIKGSEVMGVTTLTNQVSIIKNIEDDYAFYEGEPSFVKLEEGMFTLFFPDDLHMPCVKWLQASRVKKVVIKIRV